MAELLTKEELSDRIRQLQGLLDKMADKNWVCIKCDCLYETKQRGDCWCDFESDVYYG